MRTLPEMTPMTEEFLIEGPDCSGLQLPWRTAKPRQSGITMVIDGGLPTGFFVDALRSAAPMVDMVKLGWGSSLVTPDLAKKVECMRHAGVRFYFGGTLFEKFVAQDRFESYLDLVRRWGADTVEISNGTIPMTNSEKAAYIRKCADEFTVLSEVGFKDSDRSLRLSPSQWVECIREDLEAGATMVITEARESGKSGICRPDGELRWGLIEDILASEIDPDSLLFEAPNKALQTHFVTRVGANVNLGNISLSDVIGVESLRLGLRGDTLLHFDDPRGPEVFDA